MPSTSNLRDPFCITLEAFKFQVWYFFKLQIGGVELSQMKKLWQDRLFSFIHEAKPTNIDPGFFMQAMYSYALGNNITSVFSFYGMILGSKAILFCCHRLSTNRHVLV